MDPRRPPNAAMEELAIRNKPFTYLRADVQKPSPLLESALFPDTRPPDVNDLAANNQLWRRVFPRTKSPSQSAVDQKPGTREPSGTYQELGKLSYLDLLTRTGSYPSRNPWGSKQNMSGSRRGSSEKSSSSYHDLPAGAPDVKVLWTPGKGDLKAPRGAPDRKMSAERGAVAREPVKIETVTKDEGEPEQDEDADEDDEEEEEMPQARRRRRRRRRRSRDVGIEGQLAWLNNSPVIPVCVVISVTLLIVSFVVVMATQIFAVRETPFPHKARTKSTTKSTAVSIEVTSTTKKPEARMKWEPTPPEDRYGTGLAITDYEETELDSPTPSIFQCTTDACRWQRRLVDEKLNLTVDPCKDFYAYVCSAAWDFKGALPYKAAGQTYVIREVSKFISEHGHGVQAASANRSTLNFLDHASMFLASCLRTLNEQGISEWDAIRGLLREVGLDGWPYADPPAAPFHLDDVLKLVDRRLAIFAFMRVFLRKAMEDSAYVPHIDAPKNFLMIRYELLKNPKTLPYKEIIRKALTLWKSLQRGSALAHDVIRLEQALFEASCPSRRPVWLGDTIIPIQKLPKLPRLHLDAYLLHLRPDSKEVAILNPHYIAKLSTLLRKSEPRTFLNFLGVWVVVLISPFLPQSYLPRELLSMSHPDHQAHLDSRAQSCFHLVERLFPHGVRWMLRGILTRAANPDRQWETMTTAVESALATFFQQGTSWMEKSEAAAVVKQLRSLQVNYLAGREPLEQIASYYPLIDVTFEPSTSLKDYSDLMALTLQKYWESEEGSDFDARYEEPFGTSDQDSNWERSPESPNSIYLASNSLASASLVTRSAIPAALIPLIASDLARALFLSALDKANWTRRTQDRFRELEVCILERYKKRRHSNARDFLMVALSDNAVLKPLASAFKEVGYGVQFVPGTRGANLTLWRLFFVNFAAGFCVPAERARQDEARMKWRLNLPARLRVNTAVADSPEFQGAFQCPKQLTKSRCPIWRSGDAVKVA